ncbi:ferrous iron transport protein A [Defluviitalea saccharophila]|uniref:Ferrous iron transport protein A n=1 Tax=Defluviitalea saccharophila TaxID=879970 RepID=A0ABZ2YB59_9FIRM|nr:ferrous iron transport protein A [Candidatus Epulonipiscium sp.]
MLLSNATPGQIIEIVSIPDPSIRAQAIRFGLYEGAQVKCSQVIHLGPVILQNRMQEIAIGHRLAEKIQIKSVS